MPGLEESAMAWRPAAFGRVYTPLKIGEFLGAMETLKVLPWWLPQLRQRSFRSRSSSLV
jgi:hypothetical protein